MTQRDHTVLASILILVAFFAIKIDTVEIQPWDEGLYAVRGEGISLYDSWLDQTNFSLGGLYSSTAPPMASWGVAVGTSIVGHGPLGVRMFTLLCSAIALWLLYRSLLLMVDPRSAMLGVAILGTSLHWVVYSRQAMTEVPLMMFILGCFYAFALLTKTPGNIRAIVLFTVCFGGALLSKLTVSFIPLVFAAPLLVDAKHRKSMLIAVVAGLAIAAPWYITMYSTYGQDWVLAMSLPHLSEAVEGNVGSHGLLYYINQLVIAQPFLVVSLLFVPLALFKRALLPTKENTLESIALIWFVSGMIIFSIAQTKNPHYVVILLPASVIISVWAFDKVLTGASRRVTVWMYASIVVGSIWAVLSPLRASLKLGMFDPIVLVGVGVIAILIVSPLFIAKETLGLLVERGYRKVGYLAVTVGLVLLVVTVVKGRPEEIRGGRAVAAHLQEHAGSSSSFIYLYHRANAGDAMNPQLAWYTNGWMSGWREGFGYTPMHMPTAGLDIKTLAVAASSTDPWLVYYHPGRTEEELKAASEVLAVAYRMQLAAPHYTLYKRSW